MLKNFKRVHFVGIGGIGMSALARILIDMGIKVSGSDINENANVRNLRELGAYIYIPHNAELMPENIDMVVYSSAVPPDNEELLKAKSKGIPLKRRGELLALITKERFSLLVAGSHGKTTTASMMAKVAIDAGLSPTVIVGGRIVDLENSNAYMGSGNIVIAETDESDGTFLLLEPTVSVVTNIDREHLNFYGSFEELKRAFKRFLEHTKKERIVFKDDENLDTISRHLNRITYSLQDPSASAYIRDVSMGNFGSRFIIDSPWGSYSVSITMPGLHNVQNATASFLALVIAGVSPDKVVEGLSKFKGVERRLTIRGEKKGVVVVDDYAHHPTEIENTLKAIRIKWPGKKVVAVFQPHRYSRLKYLWRDFASCFKDADMVWVTDIYAAGERENNFRMDVFVRNLAKLSKTDVFYVPSWPDMLYPIMRILEGNDVVVTLGAGDIWKFCHLLLENME